MERILVASDGSPGADRAVEFAAKLARAFDAELTILTVIGGAESEDLKRFARMEKAMIGELQESEARALAARARAAAEKLGARNVSVRVEEGDAAEAILAAAKALKSEIIVIGKRGRGRLQGLLLGSVSQKLASLADRPVIIVP